MCGAMGGQPHPFEAPAFAIRQIFFLETGEEFENVGGGCLMIKILDLGTEPGGSAATSFSSGTEMSITWRGMEFLAR